jgi:hypothetical protein
MGHNPLFSAIDHPLDFTKSPFSFLEKGSVLLSRRKRDVFEVLKNGAYLY